MYDKFLKEYANVTIKDDGAYLSKEFLSFAGKFRGYVRRQANGQKKKLELAKFTTGHYFVSGFLKTTKEEFIYFSYSVPRYRTIDVQANDCSHGVFLRKAASLNDYTGGPNNYASLSNFVQKAVELV